MKSLALLIAGGAAGIAFVLACEAGTLTRSTGIGAGTNARASPSDCATWQLTALNRFSVPDDGGGVDLPAGWQPVTVYGASDDTNVFLTRCKP